MSLFCFFAFIHLSFSFRNSLFACYGIFCNCSPQSLLCQESSNTYLLILMYLSSQFHSLSTPLSILFMRFFVKYFSCYSFIVFFSSKQHFLNFSLLFFDIHVLIQSRINQLTKESN